MNKLKFIFSILLIAGTVSAQLVSHSAEDFLKLDFNEELKTADFIRPELIKKYGESSQLDVEHGINLEINTVSVAGNDLKLHSGHAILDINKYVQQRLGHHVYSAIKSGMVDIKVFSGTDDSFFKNLDVQYPKLKTATKLPSLYEEWGIVKYLVQQADSKPVLIIKIPTSYRYAQHYATMIRSITNSKAAVVEYDQNSEIRERYSMAQGARRITDKLGLDYSIVSFGYSSTWIDAVENSADWKYVSKTSAEDEKSGLQAEVVTLENKQSKRNKKILLISSKKTVWGELATMMIGAFLHKKVESVIFMGSAGAVSDKNSIYDLSVPKRFIDKEGYIAVENILNSVKLPSTNKVKINFESTHGNTFSPIEQNKFYLSAVNELGLDTIDVEQSLLAREISVFNIKNKTNVKFGAINLITDKPFSLLQEQHSDHDLDRIDMSKKKQARSEAVKFLLGGLASPDIYRTSCSFLFN